MLFFYIRHGDPIYDPDSLTVLGEKQAEALAKRLAAYGIDKVYASSSGRAMKTAKPTCDLLKKEMEIKDFANESYTWGEFSIEKNGNRIWMFQDEETRRIFADDKMLALGHKWYEYEGMSTYKKGVERISKETTEFFKELGYEKIGNTGKYKVLKSNNERVAFFAHQGFGLLFLSEILGIPYPLFTTRFDLCHSSMTVIDFQESDGFSVPMVLTLSSDSHIYREGLPTKYNNELYF